MSGGGAGVAAALAEGSEILIETLQVAATARPIL